MKQQSLPSRSVPNDPDKHLPKPQRDRLWFPISEARFGTSCVINYSEVIFGSRARMLMPRTIYAVHTDDRDTVIDCLSHLKNGPTSPEYTYWVAKLQSIPAVGGYVIPINIIDETWISTKPIDSDQLLELAVRLSSLISHMDEANTQFGSDSPLHALRTSLGRCFDKASLLTAIYRLNGIPARVVGREDFFDGNDGGHWLVEAHIGGKWQKYDSVYAPQVIEWLFEEARRIGVSPEEVPHFLAQTIVRLVADGTAVNQITSQDCLHKIEGMIVAAETDLPGEV